jgi:protein-ribulosamine 3-kinase
MTSSVFKNHLQFILEEIINEPVITISFSPVNGGSINETYKLVINNKLHFFCKINSVVKFPFLFIKEKNGLDFLRSQNIFRIPKIMYCGELEEKQILILEWINEGLQTGNFWETFGEKLAQLHTITNANFGFDEDNFMGALFQSNNTTTNWVDFFINERLQPQIKIAAENNLMETKHIDQFEKLYKQLPQIFPQPKPSLIHGDLWNENFLADENSEPILIDPAIYLATEIWILR